MSPEQPVRRAFPASLAWVRLSSLTICARSKGVRLESPTYVGGMAMRGRMKENDPAPVSPLEADVHAMQSELRRELAQLVTEPREG
jgi:hypothetical protein